MKWTELLKPGDKVVVCRGMIFPVKRVELVEGLEDGYILAGGYRFRKNGISEKGADVYLQQPDAELVDRVEREMIISKAKDLMWKKSVGLEYELALKIIDVLEDGESEKQTKED